MNFKRTIESLNKIIILTIEKSKKRSGAMMMPEAERSRRMPNRFTILFISATVFIMIIFSGIIVTAWKKNNHLEEILLAENCTL